MSSEPRFLTLTLAHEWNQSPRPLYVNPAYIVSFAAPPSYTAYDRGYGRTYPYPSNARTKLTLSLPEGSATEYVTETPAQIQELLEAQP